LPSSDTILIRSLSKKSGIIEQVSILGKHEIRSWSQTDEGLVIDLVHKNENENGYVVKADL